ncbi:hypothetical protein G6F65_020972 [Rhizopus arrhizus]|nr:hypothetical protein G6F65_020972 [Rhizopus arrhizus]
MPSANLRSHRKVLRIGGRRHQPRHALPRGGADRDAADVGVCARLELHDARILARQALVRPARLAALRQRADALCAFRPRPGAGQFAQYAAGRAGGGATPCAHPVALLPARPDADRGTGDRRAARHPCGHRHPGQEKPAAGGLRDVGAAGPGSAHGLPGVARAWRVRPFQADDGG